MNLASLPAIGSIWTEKSIVQLPIYAGLTVWEEKPHALILLPGDEELTWDKAVAWAEKQGGALPSRIDQLVLFKNLKAEFKDVWYWSGEQYAGAAGSAWSQSFDNGNQSYYGAKDDKLRARAVRRLAIE